MHKLTTFMIYVYFPDTIIPFSVLQDFSNPFKCQPTK